MAEKKTGKEAANWQDHIEKKTKGAKAKSETEISRPQKKQSVKPLEKKAAEPKAPAKEKHAAQTADNAHKDTHAHDHADHSHDHAHEHTDHSHADHIHAEHKDSTKEQKEEKKEVAKATVQKTTEKKETAKPKEKKVKAKSRKVVVKKSTGVLENRDIVLHKMGHPTFRGRFGKRNIRKKSIAKWNRWRVPRGIDVKRVISDGYMPRVGYATAKEVRNVHPSGYREHPIKTIKELESVPKDFAIRIIAGIGSRKKTMIVDKAIEKAIKV